MFFKNYNRNDYIRKCKKKNNYCNKTSRRMVCETNYGPSDIINSDIINISRKIILLVLAPNLQLFDLRSTHFL